MPLKHDTDVPSLGMFFRVLVVLDISCLRRIYSVVSPHPTVLTGEPVRAALTEYDVAGDHILSYYQTVSLSLTQCSNFDLPPLFLAPRRFPGPSFALLTAPCSA